MFTFLFLFFPIILLSQNFEKTIFKGDTCFILPSEISYRLYSGLTGINTNEILLISNGEWIEIKNWKERAKILRKPQVKISEELLTEIEKLGVIITRFSIKNQKLHGKFKVFYEDGSISQKGEYKNGFPFGSFEYFRKNGNYKLIKNYGNDFDLLEETSFSENGKKKNQIINLDYKFKKLITSWYENGNLKERGIYLNMFIEKDGEWKYWNENGTNKKVEHYSKGKKVGDTIIYDSIGNLIRYEYYKRGKLKRITKILLPERDNVKFYTEVILKPNGKEKRRYESK